jgi:cobalt/nickel transport system ATP-binding protein
MVHIIDSHVHGSCCHPAPGTITVCNVDEGETSSLLAWVKARPGIVVGAMGTRAKQCAAQEQIALEFTYGVIDKCILRALRGQDSLILTTGSMVSRVAVRVDAYCKESGNTISVASLNTANQSPETGITNEEMKNNDPSP